MKLKTKMVFVAFVTAMSFLFCGCGRSPEALQRQAVEAVNARNLQETVVGMQLRNARYMPGLEQGLRDDFAAFCQKAGVPAKTSFEEILKKGIFDKVSTNVQTQILEKSNNPLTANTALYNIQFIAEKKLNGDELQLLFVFVVATSPEGTGILQYGTRLTFNGKSEDLNLNSMLIIIGDANQKGEGIRSLMEMKAEQARKKRGQEK